MPAISLDWTAIVLGVLTLVMTAVGWVFRRSFSKLDRHMARVESFIGDTNVAHAEMRKDIKHQGEQIKSVETRLNDSRRIGEIHGMVSDIHGNCGMQGA